VRAYPFTASANISYRFLRHGRYLKKGQNALDACDRNSVRLSCQERRTLCTDIVRFSLLIGREVQRAADKTITAVATPPADVSPWEQLALLENLRPRLEAALHAIAASPDCAARSEHVSLPLHMVRGGPSTLSRLARDPAGQRAWTQAALTDAADSQARIREQRAATTVQTAPNRIAADFLLSLAQETQALHRLALFCEEQAAADSADRLRQSMRRWLRETPFREGAASEVTSRPTPPEILLRSSPAYRSLYGVLRAARSGLCVDWSESSVLRFPVLEAWHLYEIWCFLCVGVVLRDLGWRPVETDCLQIVPAGMRLRLAHGRESRIRLRAPGRTGAGYDLELFYQPLFASANRATAMPGTGYRSLSHAMQPDIALVHNGRLLLLDPKYRPYGEVGDEQEDVDKMHAYRDAIVRIDPQTGKTLPAVEAAWCLFPGLPESPSSLPARLRTYPVPTSGQPFGTAGVGAVQIRPGTQNPEIIALLQHWLRSDT
jgi:hypothetical protein